MLDRCEVMHALHSFCCSFCVPQGELALCYPCIIQPLTTNTKTQRLRMHWNCTSSNSNPVLVTFCASGHTACLTLTAYARCWHHYWHRYWHHWWQLYGRVHGHGQTQRHYVGMWWQPRTRCLEVQASTALSINCKILLLLIDSRCTAYHRCIRLHDLLLFKL